MSKINSGNGGYVELLETFGSDLTVVNAARVSFDKESTEINNKDNIVKNLFIRVLLKCSKFLALVSRAMFMQVVFRCINYPLYHKYQTTILLLQLEHLFQLHRWNLTKLLSRRYLFYRYTQSPLQINHQ